MYRRHAVTCKVSGEGLDTRRLEEPTGENIDVTLEYLDAANSGIGDPAIGLLTPVSPSDLQPLELRVSCDQ